MDFDLPDEAKVVRELARDFAQREIVPYAAEWSASEIFPAKTFQHLGQLGLNGLLVPEKYGGADAGLLTMVAVMEELGDADQSFATAWNAHTTIASLPLAAFGTEEQKERWLVPLATGQRIAGFGLTEASAGSDAASIRTRARRTDQGWLINGTKMFITNVGTDISLGVTILARLDDDEAGKARGYGMFFVPDGAPGYTKGDRLRKLGWHAADTRELVFDDCLLSEDHLIGAEGAGLRQILEVLDHGRVSVAALALSLAQAALRLARNHVTAREQFGRPLADFQAVRHMVATMATEIDAARQLVYRAAWLGDQGRPFAKEAAMAKLFASEVANRAASTSVQLHGGYGWMRESEISRFYADAKVLEIGEGTSEIQRDVIARHVLGARR